MPAHRAGRQSSARSFPRTADTGGPTNGCFRQRQCSIVIPSRDLHLLSGITTLNGILGQDRNIDHVQRDHMLLRQTIHQEGQVMGTRNIKSTDDKYSLEGFFSGLLCMKTQMFIPDVSLLWHRRHCQVAPRITHPRCGLQRSLPRYRHRSAFRSQVRVCRPTPGHVHACEAMPTWSQQNHMAQDDSESLYSDGQLQSQFFARPSPQPRNPSHFPVPISRSPPSRTRRPVPVMPIQQWPARSRLPCHRRWPDVQSCSSG